MDINNLSQEMDKIFGNEAMEENVKRKSSKKLFRAIENNLYQIVIQNISGKMGRC